MSRCAYTVLVSFCELGFHFINSLLNKTLITCNSVGVSTGPYAFHRRFLLQGVKIHSTTSARWISDIMCFRPLDRDGWRPCSNTRSVSRC